MSSSLSIRAKEKPFSRGMTSPDKNPPVTKLVYLSALYDMAHIPKIACSPMISVKNADMITNMIEHVTIAGEGFPLSRLPVFLPNQRNAQRTGKQQNSVYPTHTKRI